MNLARKLVIAGVFSLVVYTAANVYSYILQNKISHETGKLINGFHDVVNLKDINIALSNMSMTYESALVKASKNEFDDSTNTMMHALKQADAIRGLFNEILNSQSDEKEKQKIKQLYIHFQEYIKNVRDEIIPALKQREIHIVYKASDRVEDIIEKLKAMLSDFDSEVKNALGALDDNVEAAIEKTKYTQIVVLLTTLLVMVPIYYYLFSNIIKGLRKSVYNIGQLSDGNANIEIDGLEVPDETGELARSSVKLRNNLKQIQKLTAVLLDLPVGVMLVDAHEKLNSTYINKFTADILKKVESALKVPADKLVGSTIYDFLGSKIDSNTNFRDHTKLPFKIRAKYLEEMFDIQISPLFDSTGTILSLMVTIVVVTKIENLANKFESSVSGVVQDLYNAIENLKHNATTVSEIAAQTTKKSITVTESSTKASQNMNSVASATEELSASVREISERLNHSNQISGRAVQEAKSTNETIAELSEKAERIGEVIDIIMAIAEQINLLALNATIESARAGEAGKGFAVVANEVKALANQTTKASEEIALQIKGVQDSTKKVVDSIASVAKVVNEINEISSSIATSVEEQSAATNEISSNVQKTAMSTNDITTNISHVKNGAEETSGSISMLTQISQEINDKIITLKDGAEEFLKTVRN